MNRFAVQGKNVVITVTNTLGFRPGDLILFHLDLPWYQRAQDWFRRVFLHRASGHGYAKIVKVTPTTITISR